MDIIALITPSKDYSPQRPVPMIAIWGVSDNVGYLALRKPQGSSILQIHNGIINFQAYPPLAMELEYH